MNKWIDKILFRVYIINSEQISDLMADNNEMDDDQEVDNIIDAEEKHIKKNVVKNDMNQNIQPNNVIFLLFRISQILKID